MGRKAGWKRSKRTFAHALDTLKHDGSNVLVVGDADGHARPCERLYGESDDGFRCRLVVTTDRPVTSVSPWGGRTEHVVFRPDGRPDDSGTVRNVRTLSALGTEFVDAIDELERNAGSLGPGELRACVDSLEPLLEGYSLEAVYRLLHVVTTRTRLVDGVGHYHLRRDRSHETVHLLESLFDAVVELRLRDGVPEGRWHLRDRNATSGWLPF